MNVWGKKSIREAMKWGLARFVENHYIIFILFRDNANCIRSFSVTQHDNAIIPFNKTSKLEIRIIRDIIAKKFFFFLPSYLKFVIRVRNITFTLILPVIIQLRQIISRGGKSQNASHFFSPYTPSYSSRMN